MPPPSADSFAARPFAGLALRAQSDRRLVSLVRDGYETAFEEIVRRYGKPLIRYAAAIVTSNRAEDVTQDAFSKALISLRGADKEIELRPWLYRIVRNTALNDLRDQPPATAPLHENIDGVETPLDAAERREEINELVVRLRALPDPQRAAIVMRELEGLSHEEIAAALGMSGGAARQAIYRGRRALRDGAGVLVPIPLLHWLLGGAVASDTAAAAAGVGGAASLGGAGLAGGAGGAGAGVGLKAGAATLLVAGTVGAGVAVDRSSQGDGSARAAQERSRSSSETGLSSSPSSITTTSDDGIADDHGDRGGGGGDRGRHRGRGEGGGDHSGSRGPGGGDDSSGSEGPSASSGKGSGGSHDGGGSGESGGSGSSGSGSGKGSGSGSEHSGFGSSGSGSSGSGSSGSGGGDDPPEPDDSGGSDRSIPPPPELPDA